MENKQVLEAGMVSWNQICVLMGDTDMTFDDVEDFTEFYQSLCAKLFEVETKI